MWLPQRWPRVTTLRFAPNWRRLRTSRPILRCSVTPKELPKSPQRSPMIKRPTLTQHLAQTIMRFLVVIVHPRLAVVAVGEAVAEVVLAFLDAVAIPGI